MMTIWVWVCFWNLSSFPLAAFSTFASSTLRFLIPNRVLPEGGWSQLSNEGLQCSMCDSSNTNSATTTTIKILETTRAILQRVSKVSGTTDAKYRYASMSFGNIVSAAETLGCDQFFVGVLNSYRERGVRLASDEEETILVVESEEDGGWREIQRELEQAESGLRPGSRREFSTNSSRPRERYRERDNGRPTNEGNLRTSGGSGPDLTNPNSSISATPTIVLSGSRQFSGQPPTLLQSRDRQDEGGSSYEENIDGSRDSGDTGSIGEPDLVMALEGQSGNFGSGQRQVSRGNKSRQMMERRERDGRREGKWERRH